MGPRFFHTNNIEACFPCSLSCIDGTTRCNRPSWTLCSVVGGCVWCIVCLGAACVRVWGCMWLGNVWLEGKPTKHFFVVLLFAFCFCLLRSIQLFFPNLSTHSLPPSPSPSSLLFISMLLLLLWLWCTNKVVRFSRVSSPRTSSTFCVSSTPTLTARRRHCMP